MRSPRLLAAAVFLFLAAGCGDEPAPGVAGPVRTVATAAPPECPESGLTQWLGASGDDSGISTLNIELYNCGQRVARLKGYPRITVLDASARPADVKVTHGSGQVGGLPGFDDPVVEVVLEPGEVAGFGLAWRQKSAPSPQPLSTLDVSGGGAPAARLDDAPIDARTVRLVGLSPWRKVRERNGAEPGDGAPHYQDNHAWKQRLDVSLPDHLRAEQAAGTIRTIMRRLIKARTLTPEAATEAMRSAGFNFEGKTVYDPLPQAYLHADGPDGLAFDAFTGGGACLYGNATSQGVGVTVSSILNEGGCRPPTGPPPH
ncbi:DUF4232 domain-containing protein [Actinocorallia aurea]